MLYSPTHLLTSAFCTTLRKWKYKNCDFSVKWCTFANRQTKRTNVITWSQLNHRFVATWSTRVWQRRLIYTYVQLCFTIGVNAAGAAGVATPQYFTCRGRPVLTTPPIFWQVFYFFPFSGTSEYRKSLSFSWDMNLKNTTPRMHHITPFWNKKFVNFLGRGTAPPQTPHLGAYGASILASSALDLRPLNVPVALTPMYFTIVYGSLTQHKWINLANRI